MKAQRNPWEMTMMYRDLNTHFFTPAEHSDLSRVSCLLLLRMFSCKACAWVHGNRWKSTEQKANRNAKPLKINYLCNLNCITILLHFISFLLFYTNPFLWSWNHFMADIDIVLGSNMSLIGGDQRFSCSSWKGESFFLRLKHIRLEIQCSFLT